MPHSNRSFAKIDNWPYLGELSYIFNEVIHLNKSLKFICEFKSLI